MLFVSKIEFISFSDIRKIPRREGFFFPSLSIVFSVWIIPECDIKHADLPNTSAFCLLPKAASISAFPAFKGHYF